MKICKWHLCNNVVVGRKDKVYCSQSCKNSGAVSKRRASLKQKAVDYLGGKCAICGYDKCIQALQFHHIDPSQKDFGIGYKGATRSWESLRRELDKCVCLCGNCHVEVHMGISQIPT